MKFRILIGKETPPLLKSVVVPYVWFPFLLFCHSLFFVLSLSLRTEETLPRFQHSTSVTPDFFYTCPSYRKGHTGRVYGNVGWCFFLFVGLWFGGKSSLTCVTSLLNIYFFSFIEVSSLLVKGESRENPFPGFHSRLVFPLVSFQTLTYRSVKNVVMVLLSTLPLRPSHGTLYSLGVRRTLKRLRGSHHTSVKYWLIEYIHRPSHSASGRNIRLSVNSFRVTPLGCV